MVDSVMPDPETRPQAEQLFRENMSLDFYKRLMDNLYDGVYFVDLNRKITYWNKGAERLTGYKAEEVTGLSCKDNFLMHIDEKGHKLCEAGCPLAATLLDGKRRESEVFLHHKDGHRVPVLVRVEPIRDEGGAVTGAVEVFSDNSSKVEDKRRIQELTLQAQIDSLTLLGNRRYLEMELHGKFEQMRRFGIPFGILFMDIDRFKDLNDQYGHEFGDDALRVIARTLAGAIRGGGGSDRVGRWGGEEFIALVGNMKMEDLHRIGERFRALVEGSTVGRGGVVVHPTISIGATLARPRDTWESLVERADRLMYESKQAGRNRVTVKLFP